GASSTGTSTQSVPLGTHQRLQAGSKYIQRLKRRPPGRGGEHPRGGGGGVAGAGVPGGGEGGRGAGGRGGGWGGRGGAGSRGGGVGRGGWRWPRCPPWPPPGRPACASGTPTVSRANPNSTDEALLRLQCITTPLLPCRFAWRAGRTSEAAGPR